MMGMRYDTDIVARNQCIKVTNQTQGDALLRRLQMKRMGTGHASDVRITIMDWTISQMFNWKGTKSALGLVQDAAP
jgi:hypothetical protein